MYSRCVRAYVTGKVQGVRYRESTKEQALQRNISGHAKNLPDGRVEVLMCGQSRDITELSEWLWKGPTRARVTDVTVEVLDHASAPDHFTTG